jgi:hypothetical protein
VIHLIHSASINLNHITIHPRHSTSLNLNLTTHLITIHHFIRAPINLNPKAPHITIHLRHSTPSSFAFPQQEWFP